MNDAIVKTGWLRGVDAREAPKAEMPKSKPGDVSRDVVRLVPATETDASCIHAMAQACFVGRLSSLEKGFLVYPLPLSDFALAAKLEQPCCLFVNSEGDRFGFVSAFTLDGVNGFASQCEDSSIADTLLRIREIAVERGDGHGIIVHQFALRPDRQGKGLGARCFRLYAEKYPVPIYGLVSALPIANPRISFWRRLGFKEITRLQISGPVIDTAPSNGATATEEWTWILVARPSGDSQVPLVNAVKTP
jgi:GNAT superfamily N-acetyltransferase